MQQPIYTQQIHLKVGNIMYNPFNKNISEIEYEDLKKINRK